MKISFAAVALAVVLAAAAVPGRAQNATYTIPVILSETGGAAAVGVDELAARAGTIGYEILTRLGPRYARRYLGG